MHVFADFKNNVIDDLTLNNVLKLVTVYLILLMDYLHICIVVYLEYQLIKINIIKHLIADMMIGLKTMTDHQKFKLMATVLISLRIQKHEQKYLKWLMPNYLRQVCYHFKSTNDYIAPNCRVGSFLL